MLETLYVTMPISGSVEFSVVVIKMRALPYAPPVPGVDNQEASVADVTVVD